MGTDTLTDDQLACIARAAYESTAALSLATNGEAKPLWLLMSSKLRDAECARARQALHPDAWDSVATGLSEVAGKLAEYGLFVAVARATANAIAASTELPAEAA